MRRSNLGYDSTVILVRFASGQKQLLESKETPHEAYEWCFQTARREEVRYVLMCSFHSVYKLK